MSLIIPNEKPSDENLEESIFNYRFPEGPTCLGCTSKNVYKNKRDQFVCRDCYKQFRLLAGTSLENIKIPYSKLFAYILGFLTNTPAEKLTNDPNTIKTVYRIYKLIRTNSIPSAFDAKTRELIMKDEAKVFGLVEDVKTKAITIDPIPELTPRDVCELVKKPHLGNYAKYNAFITKREFYHLHQSGTYMHDESGYKFILNSHFLEFYKKHFHYGEGKSRSKNFSLYLYGAKVVYEMSWMKLTEFPYVILGLLVRAPK